MKRSEFIDFVCKYINPFKSPLIRYGEMADAAEKAGLIEPDKRPTKLQEARYNVAKYALCSIDKMNEGYRAAHDVKDKYESVITEYQEVMEEVYEKAIWRSEDAHDMITKIKELLDD